MKSRVWGCRGSIASPGPDTMRYGGNTSCVETTIASGHTLVLDAGTGMRPLGASLDPPPGAELHILLTHLHLDHLQGLGFFRPLFRADLDVHIWGPSSPVQSLQERIATYMSPPLFPVRLSDIPATLHFHDAPEDEVTIGSATVRAAKVTHQGPTVGYRIEDAGRSFAYVPDHEPGLGVTLADQPLEWISGSDLVRDVDLLFHDAQYFDHEYPGHVGWGHSSIGDVLELATRSRVGKLVLFHHDPYHTDADLDVLLDDARQRTAMDAAWVALAHEGMEVDHATVVRTKPTEAVG